jgi:hypothetical protein
MKRTTRLKTEKLVTYKNPVLNFTICINGNCTDELNAYSCQCYYGFYGDHCEHNIDDCGDNACDNNGTCIDGTASYECDCPSYFTRYSYH